MWKYLIANYFKSKYIKILNCNLLTYIGILVRDHQIAWSFCVSWICLLKKQSSFISNKTAFYSFIAKKPVSTGLRWNWPFPNTTFLMLWTCHWCQKWCSSVVQLVFIFWFWFLPSFHDFKTPWNLVLSKGKCYAYVCY